MPKITLNIPDNLDNWLNNKRDNLLIDKTKLIIKMLLAFKEKGKTAHEN